MRILYMTANPQYALEKKPDPDGDEAGTEGAKSAGGGATRKPLIRKYEKLDLWPELRNVADVLFEARGEGFVQLEVVPEVRRQDVVRYVNSRKPNIVHFSGHGERGEIVLSDARAGAMVSTEWLKGALTEKEIDVLVLNCCWSATLAEELKDEVDLIIGTKMPVGSADAAEFSKIFYDELQQGATLGEAYDLATAKYDGALYVKEHKDAAVLERTLVSEPDVAKSMPEELSGEMKPAQQIRSYWNALDHMSKRLWANVFWDVSMIVIAFEIAFIGYGLIAGAYADHLAWLACGAPGDMPVAAALKSLDPAFIGIGLVEYDKYAGWLACEVPRDTPYAYLLFRLATIHLFVQEWAPWVQWEPFAVLAVLIGQPAARFASYLWLFIGTTLGKRSLEVVEMLPEPKIRNELATKRIQTMIKRLEEYEQ